jgi:hypothetical protein
MTPATIIEHDGIRQSITEWALDYGITPGIIIGRLGRGELVADAITMPMKVGHRGQRLPIFSRNHLVSDPSKRLPPAPRKRPVGPNGGAHNAKPVQHDGLSLTIREWSQRTGIPTGRIYGRLHLGWTFADAISSGDDRRSRRRGALPQVENVVSPRTVESRVRRGWPLELAESEPAGARMGRFAHGRPGVSSDFAPSEGTGAGSTAQESPNITFSGIDA